jgi:error-prone DNA polymerase
VRPFTSLADLHARTDPSAAELATMAEVGALAALGGTRREALWQAEALGRSGKLFARVAPPPAPGPLPAMTDREAMLAELRGTGVTTGPHPIAYLRPTLDRMGVTTAAALAGIPDGDRVCTGGLVVVRQRPGTAKGFVFLSLEDETGIANIVIEPPTFEQNRRPILGNPLLVVEGRLEKKDGVISVKGDRFWGLSEALTDHVHSRDFH